MNRTMETTVEAPPAAPPNGDDVGVEDVLPGEAAVNARCP